MRNPEELLPCGARRRYIGVTTCNMQKKACLFGVANRKTCHEDSLGKVRRHVGIAHPTRIGQRSQGNSGMGLNLVSVTRARVGLGFYHTPPKCHGSGGSEGVRLEEVLI